jgi:hypothetical protein
MRRSTLVALALLLAAPVARAAAPTPVLSVQGRLETSSGAPASGTYTVVLRLFAAATGGSPLYEKTVSGLVVTGGLFDAEIGPLDPALLATNPTLWLETVVDGAALPRQPMRPSPYALQATHAESASSATTAADLTCSGCVASSEVGIQWALGSTKGGAAADLDCGAGCVSALELESGAVATVHLQAGAVTSDRAGFNYAASTSKGGPATGLSCTGCVTSGHLAPNLAVTGELSAASHIKACTANATGCGVQVSDMGLYDRNDTFLTVQTPGGLRVRSQENAAWTPLQFGGGASYGTLAVTGGNLAVTEGDITVAGASGGRLGVGTTSPAAPLHVSKGSAGTAYKLEAAPGRYLYGGSDALGTYLEQVGDTDAQRLFRIQNSDGSNNYTQLFLDGANKRIYTSGNVRVGVGTPSPGTTLDVNGDARVQGPLTMRSYLNEGQSFFVGGNTERFYAVVFYDNGWGYGPAEFEVTRSSVHADSLWFGSMMLQMRWHSSNWGHGASFLEYRNLANQKSFVARIQDYYFNPYLLVWLRGGSTYSFRSFGNRVSLVGTYGTNDATCAFDPIEYTGYSTAVSCKYLTAVDASVKGGQTIDAPLTVSGTVTAPAYNTGDIFFHKGEKMVWRMYEDEAGLYVESGVTGKHYRLVLEEMQ